jgi:hypothetical protein
VVNDPQGLDETEGSPKRTLGRLLIGVDLGHGAGRLAPQWLVATGNRARNRAGAHARCARPTVEPRTPRTPL